MQKEKEKTIRHGSFNKLDGLKHLNLLVDEGKLTKVNVEPYEVCRYEDLPKLIMDPKRDYPLLVRTSLLPGQGTLSHWDTQPRRKFTTLAYSSRAALESAFSELQKDYEKYGREHGRQLETFVHRLPNGNYEYYGNALIDPKADHYSLRLRKGSMGTCSASTFRNLMVDWNVSKEQERLSALMVMGAASIKCRSSQEMRIAVLEAIAVLAQEMPNNESELNFVVYEGSKTPVAYDWLVRDWLARD